MKTRHIFIVFILICLFLNSCFAPLGFNSGKPGSLSITLPRDVPHARGDLGGAPGSLTYEILLLGPGVTEAVPLFAQYGETVNIQVDPGEWYIRVWAYDPNTPADKKAIGETAVKVKSGGRTNAPIKMAVYTEVYDWLSLKDAVECPESHDEFIVVTGNISFTSSDSEIYFLEDKKVTIVAQNSGLSIKSTSWSGDFFHVKKGHLVIGPSYWQSENFYGSEFDLDGGSSSGNCIFVYSSASFTMNSGTIKCFVSNGVIVDADYDGAKLYTGTFTMNGGEIVECSTGVCNEGNFSLNGGKLTDNNTGVTNTVHEYNNDGPEGPKFFPGIFTMKDGIINHSYDIGVYNEGNFAMEGGSIIGSEDTGVWNAGDGLFTMTGGTITGCEYTGVVNLSIFLMKNGTITNNTNKQGSGGGVINGPDGNFTMSGGIISNNSTVENDGGGVYNEGTFSMSGGTISGNHADTSDTNYGRGGGVYNVYDGNLRFGVFTISGKAIITQNSASMYGGGIYNTTGVVFNNKGGTISGNTNGDIYNEVP